MTDMAVSVGELLMREHAALERIMLIYEEIENRLIDDDFQHRILERAARLVDDFVHDYHEETEDRRIFPAFTKNGLHAELVRTLRLQHEQAKGVTRQILEMSKLIELSDTSAANRLIDLIDRFTGIYRRHAALEATVIIPEFQRIVGQEEYMRIGAEVSADEQDLFGEGGLEQIVARIENLEKELDMPA